MIVFLFYDLCPMLPNFGSLRLYPNKFFLSFLFGIWLLMKLHLVSVVIYEIIADFIVLLWLPLSATC